MFLFTTNQNLEHQPHIFHTQSSEVWANMLWYVLSLFPLISQIKEIISHPISHFSFSKTFTRVIEIAIVLNAKVFFELMVIPMKN